MTNREIQEAVAVFSGLYTKRFMEGSYDTLMETSVGRRVRSLNNTSRHVIEAALFALTAFFDQQFLANTALKRYLKEVLLDLSPEISKRIINGSVRPELHTLLQQSHLAEECSILKILLSLDDVLLSNLLQWVVTTDPNEKLSNVKILQTLTFEELKRFGSLSPEQRVSVLNVLKSPTPQKSRPSSVQSDLDQAHQRLDSRLKKNREKGNGNKC